MLVFIDSEGDPVQEFSAILVDVTKKKIVDVFHHFVCYPVNKHSQIIIDRDDFARRHIHGLNLNFLSIHGLKTEGDLVSSFKTWLSCHSPIDAIYAHAPHKEKQLLSLTVPILDVGLKVWAERDVLNSHRVALAWKLNCLDVNDVSCCKDAHSSFKNWKPKNVKVLSLGDLAKMKFSYHCSLYDCVECFLYFMYEKDNL